MPNLFDAFISYGRADSKAFATKLHARLMEQGFNLWFDQNDIPLAVNFQNQIDDGIEKTHNFLFIIAPHSVNSEYCLKEINLAVKLNKRIIPLLHVEEIGKATWQQRTPQGTDVDWEQFQTAGKHSSYRNMPPSIGKINWVYFREGIDDFEKSFASLVSAMRSHADYVKQHTQILGQALEWERHHKHTHYLLIAEARLQAKSWLKIRFPDKQPPCQPSDLHCEFICESIKNANNMMTQVFLSYVETDQILMEKLKNTLMRESITVWTNKTDIQVGADSQAKIYKGIEEADNLVYLVSPASVQSKYCDRELKHALAYKKRIILLLIAKTKLIHLPREIQGMQLIDFTAHQDDVLCRLSTDKLLKELNQDAVYYQQHKILLVKALKWHEQNHNPSILLRGYNLQHFEAWLKTATQRSEHLPLPLQEEFIDESRKQSTDLSLEVFISYSRTDSDFARQLNDALQMQGKTTWFDQESIASGTDFQQEIYRGIENSDNFLFIISPSSVNSPYCADEVEYAQRLEKRFVTVLYRQVSPAEMHPFLKQIQWLDFTQSEENFYINFSELVRILDTDREHVRSHSKWGQRAREWVQQNKSADLLLRGSEFSIAENWLQQAEQSEKQPQLTDLQREFIITSQNAIEAVTKQEKRRIIILRTLLASVSIALVVAISIGFYAFQQKNLAEQQKELANQNAELAKQEKEQALRSQSIALSAVAQQALKEGRTVDGMLLALKALPKSMKKPNRPYVNDARLVLHDAVLENREKIIFRGHKHVLYNATFSPDGKLLLTASKDKTARLWDVKTGQPVGEPFNHTNSVYRAIFSPNGDYILTASGNTAYLWNTETHQQLAELSGHTAQIYQIAFSPDNKRILTGSLDKTARLWHVEPVETAQQPIILEGHQDRIQHVAFSPNGQIAVTTSRDKTARLWNATTGQKLLELLEHQKTVLYAAFSPDSQRIVTVSLDKTARLWDTKTAQQLAVFSGHKDAVYYTDFSLNGQYIVTTSKDMTARLWDANTYQELAVLAGHTDQVGQVTFSPTGQILVTTSDDGTARLWEVKTGKQLAILAGHKAPVYRAFFSPNGQSVVTASYDMTARLWDVTLQNITVLVKNKELVHYATFSPNGQRVATASNLNVRLWNVNTHQVITMLTEHQDIIDHIAFRSDGQHLVTTSRDGTARVWNVNTGKSIAILNHHSPVEYASFSPNEKWMLTQSKNALIRLWDTSQMDKPVMVWTGYKPIFSPDSQRMLSLWYKNAHVWDTKGTFLVQLEAHSNKIAHATFSPNGKRIVTASWDNTARLWDTNTGNVIAVLKHKREVLYADFSPDGKHIVTASMDRTARLWDGNTGKPIRTFKGHEFFLTYATFSPDGQSILTASRDATARVWNINNGQTQAILKGHQRRIFQATFSSDGKHVLTTSWDGTARLWRIFPDTQALIDYANKIVSRRLTAKQR